MRLIFLVVSFALVLLRAATYADSKTIHVFVALCDNLNQGIVPVPAFLGNGDSTKNNLYWGAMYGVKTYFGRSSHWQMVSAVSSQDSVVLERCVFRHRSADAYLVADAYRGSRIKDAIIDFLRAASGETSCSLSVGDQKFAIAGGASLVAYVGHNGLMDFSLDGVAFNRGNTLAKPAIVLACASRSYFGEPLRECGAHPLLWTTGLMAPEAYTLEAAVQAWIEGKAPSDIRDAAAQAYNRFQNCGLTAAKRLLVTGW